MQLYLIKNIHFSPVKEIQKSEDFAAEMTSFEVLTLIETIPCNEAAVAVSPP